MVKSQPLNIIPTSDGVSLTVPSNVKCTITIEDERASDLLLLFDSLVGEVQGDMVVPIVYNNGNITIQAMDTRQTSLDVAAEFAERRVALKQQAEDEFREQLERLQSRQRVAMQNAGSDVEPVVMVEKTI